MILAFDVAYNENNIAQAVAIGFTHWQDETPDVVYKEFVIGLEPYQPGEFYKRELPCIEKILNKLNLASIELIVIDGYVFLDDSGKPGLGAHLYKRLQNKIPVIGVAKSSYAGNSKYIPILRGESKQPLFVSAIGIDVLEASTFIQNMAGKYRIPDLLKKLDQLTKR
jgi:deoxyribonuclease V